MPDRITQLVPRPRRVTIGGASFGVWPATLYDLADLQSCLDALWPDPLAELWAELSADPPPEGEARWAAIRRAYAKADEGPPEWDGPAGAEWLASREGAAALLYFALGRCHPEMTPGDAAERSAAASPAERAAVRVAWLGVDTANEIGRMLLDGFPLKRGGRPTTWAKAVHETAEAFGWTYPQVYSLTLAEFANARRGGGPAKGPEIDYKPGDPEMIARWRERVEGPDEAHRADAPSV